jgi:hypothetical protein
MKHFDPFQENRIPEPLLEEYLRLCQEIYSKMKTEGKWPWPDSQNSEDLLESKETKI